MKKIIITITVAFLVVISILYLENQNNRPPVLELNNDQQSKEKIFMGPELQGISGYINTEPITIQQFRGKVVLIDFWTYSCINCIRTLPFLKEWHEKYSDKGLVIIGVHTPEFNFEKKYENVKNAVEKFEIKYAVVQDNDYATWRAFQNRYWPRKYLIDAEGVIRYDHIGEGAYQETERVIQELLAEIGEQPDEELTILPDLTPIGPQTPELYAGYKFALPRGQNIGNEQGIIPDKEILYEKPDMISPSTIYLDGPWLSNEDSLQAKGESSIILDFKSTGVNIVAEAMDGPIEMDAFINGEYIEPYKAGDDIKYDGERSFLLIEESRLYNIFKGPYTRAILTLQVNSSNVAFNAFTFG